MGSKDRIGIAVALSNNIRHKINVRSTRQRRPHTVHGVAGALVQQRITWRVSTPAWGAVYECLAAEGKPVLTNKPAQFHDCRLLSEGTYPEQKPSEVSSPSQESPPSIRPDEPYPMPDAPYPPPHAPSAPPNLSTP